MKIFKTAILFILIIFLSLNFWSFFFRPSQEITPIFSWLSFAAGLPYSNKTTSFILQKNQVKNQVSLSRNTQEDLIYYSISNLGKKIITPQVIINGQDWFSDQGILDSALRNFNKNSFTNQDKVLAIFKFVTDNQSHWHTPLYGTSYYYVDNPVRYLNNWGYGFCSDSSTILIQLLTLAGYNARLVNLVDHVVAEVFYDGFWHVLDPDMEVYYLNKKGRIASVEDIVADNSLLDFPIWLREISNNTKASIRQILAKAYSQPPKIFTPAERGLNSKKYQSQFKYQLRPGEEIRFYYNFPGKFYWSYSDKKPPEFTNGILISRNKGGLIRTTLPYPIVSAYLYKPGLCKPPVPRFSLDGIHWKKLPTCQDDILNFFDLFPVGEKTYPIEKYFLLLPFSFKDYQLLTQFQIAPKSIPRFNFETNMIELKEALNSDIKLEFGWYIEQ